MNHDVVLALVSAVWVALELVVGLITRSTAGKSTRQDRGSYTLMWILLIVAAFVGGMIHQLPVARMPFPNATFWFGIALILGGMAIRATAIATLRRFFTTQVTIQESHELIDRGLYSVIRHPSYTGALI
ncbi:MAG TPA: isoprenylcysteine carboxylmethyltransferase family protein, partial [Thermoanaerobaculia bacterium]